MNKMTKDDTVKKETEKMKRERRYKEGEIPEDFEKNIQKALDFTPKRKDARTSSTASKVKKKKKK